MLWIPDKCLRERSDCRPMAQIESDSGDHTFICCGENDGSTRALEQDKYRLCIKGGGNPPTDSIEDCDRRDLTHQMAVIAQALAIIAEEQD